MEHKSDSSSFMGLSFNWKDTGLVSCDAGSSPATPTSSIRKGDDEALSQLFAQDHRTEPQQCS